jgi:hypothetical protein
MGLIAVRKKQSDLFMFVDADDLISKRIVTHVQQNVPSNGFILKTGYRYELGHEVMYVDKHFNCGTNSIIRADRMYLPKSLDEDELVKCLIFHSGHHKIESNMALQGTPLAPLPFRGGVYVQHSGQHSRAVNAGGEIVRPTLRMKLGALRRVRSARLLLAQEFGITLKEARSIME